MRDTVSMKHLLYKPENSSIMGTNAEVEGNATKLFFDLYSQALCAHTLIIIIINVKTEIMGNNRY